MSTVVAPREAAPAGPGAPAGAEMVRAPAALEVEALEAAYEPGLPIVRGASLAVAPGEILSADSY